MARGSQATTRTDRKSEETGRDAILDAAERLFAERGIDAVSLRTINSEAGYSVAALHYHFGTREGLIRALLERAQPLMFERRQRMLAELRPLARPSLEHIVEALVVPLTEGLFDERGNGGYRLRFLTRLYFDRSPYMAGVLEASLRVFLPLLRRALPGCDDSTLTRRWALASELAVNALSRAQPPRRAVRSGAKKNGASDPAQLVRDVVSFITAGLRAPHGRPSVDAQGSMTGAPIAQNA